MITKKDGILPGDYITWSDMEMYPSADKVSVIPLNKMKPTQRILFVDNKLNKHIVETSNNSK